MAPIAFLVMAWRRRRQGAAARRRRAGVSRVLAYLLALALASTFFSGRRAAAGVTETGLALGRSLARMEPPGATAITLNGERVDVETRFVTDDLTRVLTTIAEGCTTEDGGRGVVVRRELADARGEGEGLVVCVRAALGDGERWAAFARSMDAAGLGGVRYAYLKREAGGVTVISVATRDTFRLDRIAWTGEGDAPGSDAAWIPRPDGGRRVLSAVMEGRAQGVFVYRTDTPGGDVIASLDRAMRGRGFTPMLTRDPARRAWTRAATGTMLFAAVAESEGARIVSLAEIP